MFHTKTDGIYYWRTEPNLSLPPAPPPHINSNMHDLLLDGCLHHGPLNIHSFMDAEWETCLLTQCSMGGGTIMLVGGAIGYKANVMPTMAMSSTETEFMEADIVGRIVLYCCSVMWDLGVPQCAATIGYEENDTCTAMTMAQKPT